MRRFISLISFALFLLLGVSLALFNPHPVMFDYFFAQASLPLSILLALSFLIGLFLAGLLLSTKLWATQWQLKKSIKKLKQQDAEILQLKKNINHLEAQAELQHVEPQISDAKGLVQSHH
ncbi:lipopolysaccharide assembly protein LapA domain-containing protein [Thiomicrospira sp. ALE5]|uniref:lipopolysaccharide assembly protein LapA domain-containing protein n=1 Tax=Thiomicrospira sp. ALE5 TaxID=748650 RepID=UPI0008E13B8E|nr:LapA family protein [Thiomicrospira sp. ALE5]SFR49852.1 Protein of unknown function [Thiomicrospira sp. ALE5]